MDNTYDIVVLGSGIAGSSLALVLSQIPQKVLVLERGSHPRFAIGEGTIPGTTLMFRDLAHEYNVPELAEMFHYPTLRERGCTAFAKLLFWFGYHEEDKPLEPRRELCLEALTLPHGPDAHLLRHDVDAYLVSLFDKYNVDYRDHTAPVDFVKEERGVRLTVEDEDGQYTIRARLAVDASGHSSFFAKRFNLRHEQAQLDSNSRAIFGHFKNVPDLEDVVGEHHPDFRFPRHVGTMHHWIPGGWIWVIPFDNGVTSVGFMLDREHYPLDESITPEAEVAAIIARYPTIRAALDGIEPVVPWIRTDRVQFTSRSSVGDGFVLTPHASGFVEPLYSSGLCLTGAFIGRFSRLVKKAAAADDYGADMFQPLEELRKSEIKQIDRLVSGTFMASRNFELFRQFWRAWMYGSSAHWLGQLLFPCTLDHPVVYGTGVEGFCETVEEMYQALRREVTDDAALALELKSLIDPWHERLAGLFTDMREWVPGSNSPAVFIWRHGENRSWLHDHLLPNFSKYGATKSSVDERLVWYYGLYEEFYQKYEESQARGSQFHRTVDEAIFGQMNPGYDYKAKLFAARMLTAQMAKFLASQRG